eukprot:gene11422-12769_t
MAERPGSFWYSGMNIQVCAMVMRQLSEKYNNVANVSPFVIPVNTKIRNQHRLLIRHLVETAIQEGKQMLILPIVINTLGNSDFDHANLIVWRFHRHAYGQKIDHVVELFEPHGNGSLGNRPFWDSVEKDMRSAIRKENNDTMNTFSFVSPEGMQPLQSMQNMETLNTPMTFEGLCVLWSIFVSELAMAHPDLTLGQIGDAIFHQANPPKKTQVANQLLSYMLIGYLDELDQAMRRRFEFTIVSAPIAQNVKIELYKSVEHVWSQLMAAIGTLFNNRFGRWAILPAGKRVSNYVLSRVQQTIGVKEYIRFRGVTNMISRFMFCYSRDWAENCPDDKMLVEYLQPAVDRKIFFTRKEYFSSKNKPQNPVTAFEKMVEVFRILATSLAVRLPALAFLVAVVGLMKNQPKWQPSTKRGTRRQVHNAKRRSTSPSKRRSTSPSKRRSTSPSKRRSTSPSIRGHV